MEPFKVFRKTLLTFWQQSRLVRYGSLLILAIAAALAIIVPVLSQPVVLTFLMNAPETPELRPLIQEFERQNPDIKLNMIEGPNASNLVEDLNTSAFLLGSSPYDLVHLDVVWVPKFAAAGWLLDLTDRIPKSELAKYLPGDVNGGMYEDRLYRVPWRTDAGMLYYRKDLLQQAGLQPPETFADLMRISKNLKQKDAANWGYVWQGRQYEGVSAMFVEVLEGNGGFWVNPDTKEVGLDKPEAIDAVRFLLSTIQEGISPPGVTNYQEEEARRLFQNGNAVLMRNWPYAFPLMNAADSPVRGKFAIKPMVHGAGHRSAACLGGWGWGIASTTKHPKDAWRLVQFFTKADTQRQYILRTGYLPSLRSLYNDPAILAKYPYFSQILDVLETSALRPPIAQYAQASDILQRYLSAAFSRRMSPEDAMRSAARETRRLLGTA
jgi:multiple sugar transport system substrate-binding protein